MGRLGLHLTDNLDAVFTGKAEIHHGHVKFSSTNLGQCLTRSSDNGDVVPNRGKQLFKEELNARFVIYNEDAGRIAQREFLRSGLIVRRRKCPRL